MTGMQVIEDGRITDSSSIVPIVIVNDVTADRALDVIYTNTIERTLSVIVSVLCYTPNIDSTALFYARINGLVDIWLGGNGYHLATLDAVVGENLYSSNFLVKPGETYEIKTQNAGAPSGTTALRSWIESY